MELEGSIRDADQAVEVESLVKCYGELVAVDSLSLRIPRGQVLDLLGPSGSGKTTTISCILQLFTCGKGAIWVFGQPMTSTIYGLRRCIGVVPQDVAVSDELAVTENINALRVLHMRDRATRRRLVGEMIAFVDLEEFVKFKPKKLFGGLLCRLDIACGIVYNPDLIILSEPTVAVNPQSRNTTLDGITRLNEQGATIIYMSHYMEGVEQLRHRIVIMDRGRQAASSTSDELKAMIGTDERIRVEIAGPVPLSGETLESLRRLEHIRTVTYRGPEVFAECSSGARNLSDVMGALAAAGATYGRVTFEPPTFNDVFLEIAGRALRDEAA